MKFGMMIQHRTAEVAQLLKLTSSQNQNCPLHLIWHEIQIVNNAATDHSISLTFCPEFIHTTPEVL